ncbi:hypothetical protein ACQP3F_31410, partial [Escherichia coli]
ELHSSRSWGKWFTCGTIIPESIIKVNITTMYFLQIKLFLTGMMVDTFNSSIHEAEAGGLLKV